METQKGCCYSEEVKITRWLFPVFVSVWFLALLLMGNSAWEWYFYGAFVLVEGWTLRKQKPVVSPLLLPHFSRWFFFLATVGFSLLTTLHFPMTLQKAGMFFFALYLFLAVSIAGKNSHLIWEKVFSLLKVNALVLIFLSAIFHFFPSLSVVFPSMNVLYSAVGHNHLGAFLLMVMPLFWFSFFRTKEKGQLLGALLCLLFIFLSLGRVLLVIALVQNILLFIVARRWLQRPKNAYAQYVFGMYKRGVGVVIAAAVVFWVASLVVCSVSANSVNRYCRPTSAISRQLYWEQAIKILIHYPITGSGIGTYVFSSKQYLSERATFSDYAHNYFLTMFAEAGTIGGTAFAVLMLGLLFQAFRVSRAQWREDKLEKPLIFLAILASFLNALFDFDWDLVGIFLLTIFFLAYILRSEKLSSLNAKKLSEIPITKSLLGVGVLGMVAVYAVLSALLWSGNTTSTFKIFPYFYWQGKTLVTSSQLGGSEKSELLQTYQVDFPVLEAVIAHSEEDDGLRTEAYAFLEKTYPWDRILKNRLQEFADIHDYPRFLEEGKTLLALLAYQKNMYKEELDYPTILGFIHTCGQAARSAYQAGNYQASGEILLLAQQFNPWALDFIEPPFLIEDHANQANRTIFTTLLKGIEVEKFGQYQEVYERYFMLTPKTQ